MRRLTFRSYGFGMAWVKVSSDLERGQQDWERKRREIIDRYDLSYSDLQSLQIYNQEYARGLLHTPEWQCRMAGIQARLDQRDAEVKKAFAETRSAS
jgi:hypothetical protein